MIDEDRDLEPEPDEASDKRRKLLRRAFEMLHTAGGEGLRMLRDHRSLEDLLVHAQDVQDLSRVLVESIELSIGAGSVLTDVKKAAGEFEKAADELDKSGFTHTAEALRKAIVR